MIFIKKRYLLLALFVSFVSLNNIIAIGNETLENGVCLKFSDSLVSTDDSCSQLNYIYSIDRAFIRMTDLSVIEDDEIECTIDTNWNSSEAIGEAYLINKITGRNGGKVSLTNDYTKYYWLNLATAKYINSILSLENNFSDALITMESSNFKLPGDLSFNDIIKAANNYKNAYSKDIKLKLSDDNLKFTKSNYDNYYSQKFI